MSADRPTTAPVRLQRTRAFGFDLQMTSQETNGLPAVYVGRPGKWGNPYSFEKDNDHPYSIGQARLASVRTYAAWLEGAPQEVAVNGPPPTREEIRHALQGKNLACWCKLGEPCHADVLLAIANEAAL
jgi:hypothetical protein